MARARRAEPGFDDLPFVEEGPTVARAVAAPDLS